MERTDPTLLARCIHYWKLFKNEKKLKTKIYLKKKRGNNYVSPPTWIDLKKNVFTYRDTETHFLVRHQHRHLYLYQIQLCSFYQQLCMPTKQIVIFL